MTLEQVKLDKTAETRAVKRALRQAGYNKAKVTHNGGWLTVIITHPLLANVAVEQKKVQELVCRITGRSLYDPSEGNLKGLIVKNRVETAHV
jgi:carbamoylphosphate synthase small subunit